MSKGYLPHPSEASPLIASESLAIRLVYNVCCLAGSTKLLDDTELAPTFLRKAIIRHDTSRLFQWFAEKISYQGISDRVAAEYIRRNGFVSWPEVSNSLSKASRCSKLAGYWSFYDCGYDKTKRICAHPNLLSTCPLPQHKLRKGQLNQSAYSLFFFFRDVANGDIVSWLDQQIRGRSGAAIDDNACENLLSPMRGIFGVSDKILSMALSELLLAAPAAKKGWREIGCRLIAIDSLVHNFLWRTGILATLGREHSYGPACYQTGGCSPLVRRLAEGIDAQSFNRNYPTYFPRFVQHAIWRFCAADGLNICNGNQIDNEVGCRNGHCRLFGLCGRKIIKNNNKINILGGLTAFKR